ncbi:MAG TPA: PAS domain-containing protein, partial [Bradyrhizobium sp.]|nr:PAS domain-containing protein [Bradyrhizobium sp.]
KLDAAWRAHLATGKPFEIEHRLRRADGEYRWFLFRRVPRPSNLAMDRVD